MRAVSFGIGITNDGYHMFALGPAGTGKKTTIRKFLEREAGTRPAPDDWLYMNNFDNPDNPRALRLPAGVGCKLRGDMDRLADELRSEVPRTFESPEYSKQQEQLGEGAAEAKPGGVAAGRRVCADAKDWRWCRRRKG